MPRRGQSARYEEYWEDDDGAYWQTEYAEEEEEHEYAKSPSAEPARLSEEAQQQQVEDSSNFSADEGVNVCAVCLSAIEPADLAIIKGCEHVYCVNCILQWALYRDAPTCPQCKVPFNYLYTHKLLDGQLSDCPVEESVCLLKRATWFVEHIKTLEKGKAVSAAMAAADEGLGDWVNDIAQYDDEDEYDEEEELEKYYFSSAAGRARVVLGNRRLGENGYMRAGRMYARPANNSNNGGSGAGSSSSSGSSNRAAGANIGKAGKGRAGGAGAGSGGSGAGAAAGVGDGGGGGSGTGGPAPAAAAAAQAKGPGQGRRAKRNARRAAADLSLDGLDLD